MRPRPASPEQHLVYVVVEDFAEALQIETREADRETFRERVADRIGVTDALSLDDLELA